MIAEQRKIWDKEIAEALAKKLKDAEDALAKKVEEAKVALAAKVKDEAEVRLLRKSMRAVRSVGGSVGRSSWEVVTEPPCCCCCCG